MATEVLTKKRSAYWDNIKGFLIFLVVFAHFLYSFQDNTLIKYIVLAIYTFHMPAFVFATGYFSKSDHSRSPAAIAKLVAAYFVFNGIFILRNFALGKSMDFLSPYFNMWYLLAVIAWRLTVPYLRKRPRTLLLTFLVAILVGFCADIGNVFAIRRIIAFYPFFLAGYMFTPDQLATLGNIAKKKKAAILTGGGLLLAGLLFAAYKIFRFSVYDLIMCKYDTPTEALCRMAIFIIACLAIFLLLCAAPSGNIPFLTKIGRNSLSIYLLHRYFALGFTKIYSKYFENYIHARYLIPVAFVLSVLLAWAFGSQIVSKPLNRFLDCGADIVTKPDDRDKCGKWRFVYLLLAILLAISPVVKTIAPYAAEQKAKAAVTADTKEEKEDGEKDDKKDPIYNVMPSAELAQYQNAFRLVFTGDLILLEDQVKRAYDGENYNFDDMFEYTSPYIQSADMAIGVFEGPMGGGDIGYSSSNYADKKHLAVNYPDTFADAVQKAGFDIVTTANNHLLDKGEKAAHRTLDVLDDIGLPHIGSYRNAQEKEQNNVLIYEKGGIKFAILAYTFGCNRYETSDFVDGDYSYITSVLVRPDSDYFDEVKESVKKDFDKAKEYNPDLIIVLPHMGTQFVDEPNEYQKTWCQVFKECGADIILGDHTHSVQPMEFDQVDGRTIFTAYCPGNYANIYREYNGDASAIEEVYIDRNSKEVIGSSIIPMWTTSTLSENYRALPVYDILTNDDLKATISTDDLVRVDEVNKHISKVMLGTELDMNMVRQRYYYTPNGFARTETPALTVTDEMRQGILYPLLSDASSVYFIGDSITEGTKNGGYPWYEPIQTAVNGKIFNFSVAGGTVKTLLDHVDDINQQTADLYVIAIGANDVRYRDDAGCAMTAEEYVSCLKTLADGICEKNPAAKFVFIAPWTSADGDRETKLKYTSKMKLIQEYAEALENFCESDGYSFVNANPYIDSCLSHYITSDYLMDNVYPNSTGGIRLYAEAAMLYR